MKVEVNKNKNGYTLIELLLYMAIATVLVIVISTASINMLRVSKKANLMSDLQYTSTFIMDKIDKVSLNAYAIENPIVNSTSSSITFRMYDTELDPTIIFVSDGVITLTEGSSDPIKLHSVNFDGYIVATGTTPSEGFDSITLTIIVSDTSQGQFQSLEDMMVLNTALTLYNKI